MHPRQVCPSLLSGVVGAGWVKDAVHAVDTDTSAFVSFRPPSECSQLGGYPLSGTIAAAPTPDGWIVVLRDSTSGARLAFLPNGDSHPLIRSLPQLGLQRDDAEWLYLSRTSWSQRSVLLGSRRRPFSWAVLDQWGRVVTPHEDIPHNTAPPNLLDLFPAGEARAAFALPPLDVGRAYVRVIVDLKSDWRGLELLDRSGRLVRQVIIGTRVSDVTELVVYGWRWHAATLARGRSPS